jgi:hypothetical protein
VRVSRVSRAVSSTGNRLSLDRTIALFNGFLRRSDGLSAVAGPKCPVLPSARKIATCGVWRAVTKVTGRNMSNCRFGRIVTMTLRLLSLADVKLPPAASRSFDAVP